MRYLTAVLLFAATEALAFNPDEWMKRRSAFADEALAMRQAYSNVCQQVSEPAENVQVPIELRADGSVKSSISARRAQFFLREGTVWAEDVVVRQFGEDGEEESRIESAHLLFDRATRHGWSEGSTRVRHGKTVFSGTDVFFATDEEYVLSLSSAALESKDLKLGGVR